MRTTDDSSSPWAADAAQPSRRALLVAAARAGAGLTLGSATLGAALAGRADAATLRAPVDLAYWTHNFPPANNLNKALVGQYMRSNPQVKITFNPIAYASYDTKLLTAFAGGGGPDVFWNGDWQMAEYIAKGLVAPFDASAYGVASQQAFIDRYDPQTFDGFMANGTLYTGGISEYDNLCILYNKALFRAEGIPYPSETEPMTWEQTAAIAQKLTKFSGGKRVQSGWEFVYGQTIWAVLQIEPLVRQLGGQLVNSAGMPQFDSAPVIQTMQFYHDLRTTYKANDPAFPSADLAADVAKGRVAMWIAGIWAIPDMLLNNPKIKGDVGVAPVPTWSKGGKRVGPKYAWAWYVNAHAAPQNQQAAWRFISSLTAHDDQWFDTCGYTEPLRTHWAYMLRSQPLLQVFRSELQYAQYIFRSPHYGDLSDVLNRAFTNIQSGADPTTVMKNAQQEALRAVR